jgi:hypothetical protein
VCVNLQVVIDPATGMSKGFGFVRFGKEEERDQVSFSSAAQGRRWGGGGGGAAGEAARVTRHEFLWVAGGLV